MDIPLIPGWESQVPRNRIYRQGPKERQIIGDCFDKLHGGDGDFVCLLNLALYELRQSAFLWHELFASKLISIGFTQLRGSNGNITLWIRRGMSIGRLPWCSKRYPFYQLHTSIARRVPVHFSRTLS